jgi:hypothetical protein
VRLSPEKVGDRLKRLGLRTRPIVASRQWSDVRSGYRRQNAAACRGIRDGGYAGAD